MGIEKSNPTLQKHFFYCSCSYSVKLQRALRWAFLFFIEHVFRVPSQSQLHLPTAPFCLPLREPGCGPGLLPTCVRPCPPCDRLGRARPGGGLPPPSWDAIRHSCRTFPLKIPAAEPALPPRGGFDFSGFPSFYFPSCLSFGCGANLRPVPGRFQRYSPLQRVALTPCTPKPKNPRKVWFWFLFGDRLSSAEECGGRA